MEWPKTRPDRDLQLADRSEILRLVLASRELSSDPTAAGNRTVVATVPVVATRAVLVQVRTAISEDHVTVNRGLKVIKTAGTETAANEDVREIPTLRGVIARVVGASGDVAHPGMLSERMDLIALSIPTTLPLISASPPQVPSRLSARQKEQPQQVRRRVVVGHRGRDTKTRTLKPFRSAKHWTNLAPGQKLANGIRRRSMNRF